MPPVSVIVCANTLRRWDFLLETLGSVERQTFRPHELIVVVDYNDELRERLELVLDRITAFPARATTNVYERGLSGARNTGIDEASGDILAFIDDDAVANVDWLEILGEGYVDPRVWGVGGRAVPCWLGRKPSWLAPEFYWVIGCTYKGMRSRFPRCGTSTAATPRFEEKSSTRSGGSPLGWGDAARSWRALKRLSCACVRRRCGPISSSCSRRTQSCATLFLRNGLAGRTSCRAASRRVARKPGWSARLAWPVACLPSPSISRASRVLP
jgi:hypothetical protein